MPIPNWGLLAKSAVDAETIEEAITRLIVAHNDNEESHLAVGQSLQSHKAAEIIDHLALSIIADKIAPETIDLEHWNMDDFFLDLIPCVSLDGFNTNLVGGGSYVYARGSHFQLSADVAENDQAFLRTIQEWETFWKAGQKTIVQWYLRYIKSSAQNTIYFLFTSSGGYPPTDTVSHAGFKIINGRIWASSAYLANQETTDTGLDIETGYDKVKRNFRIEVVRGAGGYVKFYVDGVLVATHTVYIPGNPDAYMTEGIKHTGADGLSKGVDFHRVLIQRAF